MALALTRNPNILFLDEPTAGLDVEGRLSLHEQIRQLKAMGKTIMLASHDNIRHAAIDAARSIRSRRSREISLHYLIDEKHYPFNTSDEYFAESPTNDEYPFTACGQTLI